MYRPSIGSWPDHSKFDAPKGCQIYIQLYISCFHRHRRLTLLKKRNPAFLTIFNNNYFQFLQKKNRESKFRDPQVENHFENYARREWPFSRLKNLRDLRRVENHWAPRSQRKVFEKLLTLQNWEPLSAKNKRNWNAEECGVIKIDK